MISNGMIDIPPELPHGKSQKGTTDAPSLGQLEPLAGIEG